MDKRDERKGRDRKASGSPARSSRVDRWQGQFGLSAGEAERYVELTAALSDEEADTYVRSVRQREQLHEQIRQDALDDHHARERADRERGMRAAFPAEVARARSELERSYREHRAPSEQLSSEVMALAAEATLALANHPDLAEQYRAVYTSADDLHDDYVLWSAARFLQGTGHGTASDHTASVLRVLAGIYWDRDDTHELLGSAIEALRTFGGASETRTPQTAVMDKVGKPPRATRKSLGIAVRRLSELRADTYVRQRLERCIRELENEDARKYIEYVYLGRGPSGEGKGTFDLDQEGWTKGRRMDEAKSWADAELIRYFPGLARLKS